MAWHRLDDESNELATDSDCARTSLGAPGLDYGSRARACTRRGLGTFLQIYRFLSINLSYLYR